MKPKLAPLPPMGWNSWNQFGWRVDDASIRGMAEAMVRLGFKDLGYEYVVIDDCWSVKEGRGPKGELVPDPQRFPVGIKAVADHVHKLGLKFGIYSCAAERTCAGHPGSLGHEEQDAKLFAEWGVDLLKYDYCNAPWEQAPAIARYTAMGRALEASGRPILFSMCEWGGRAPEIWGREAGGHMWRASGDLFDSWVDIWVDKPGYWGLGVDQAFDLAARLAPSGGPEGWNDLDMLVVGLRGKGQIHGGGLNQLEYQAHMSLWCMACSPLMMGCDIRSADEATLELLKNPEVLALNQDPLATPARRVRQEGNCEVWVKPLQGGARAAMLVNRGSRGADCVLRACDLGLLDTPKKARELWPRQDVAELCQEQVWKLLPHQARLFKIG